MYDVDDAIARLDSYIVSVADAGRHVGERRLVRIDSVGRSAANASLVDAEEPPSDSGDSGRGNGSGGSEGPDGSGSTGRRRRGRRGGRGRRGRSGVSSDSSD